MQPAITPHFYAGSDRSGWEGAPDSARQNLASLAQLLERVRSAGGGVPMLVTSGYRSPAHNAAVGGSKSSQHVTGSAADFRVIGRSGARLEEWASQVFRALPRQSYGQAILYPWTTGHVHIGLPNRVNGRTGEILVEVGASDYALWEPGTPFPLLGASGHTDRSDREGAALLEMIIVLVVLVALAAAI